VPVQGSTPTIHPYIPGTPLSPKANVTLPHPIKLTPRRRNVYFVPRESFNLVGMFSNPMMMMMVVTAVLMLAAPYMMVCVKSNELCARMTFSGFKPCARRFFLWQLLFHVL
jgi:hypothetical protein